MKHFVLLCQVAEEYFIVLSICAPQPFHEERIRRGWMVGGIEKVVLLLVCFGPSDVIQLLDSKRQNMLDKGRFDVIAVLHVEGTPGDVVFRNIIEC